MSTAVMEEAPPIAKWISPKAYAGQIVLWYQTGEREGPAPIRAMVESAWPGGALRLRAIGGGVYGKSGNHVRHVDDPYFIAKPLARSADGAWDLTEFDREQTAYLATLKDTIEAIQEDIRYLKSLLAKPKKADDAK